MRLEGISEHWKNTEFFPGIKLCVIHQENAGLSAARNAGLDIAKAVCPGVYLKMKVKRQERRGGQNAG